MKDDVFLLFFTACKTGIIHIYNISLLPHESFLAVAERAKDALKAAHITILKHILKTETKIELSPPEIKNLIHQLEQ
ncbi:MAG: hypothetical protein E6Q35_03670 [Chryseobacterium cucumeris]|nr:MAG: hypothetical protein E6Q35_03670 [Chryseobacterium cucumeris]